jgi:hypothetical protein
MNQSFAGSDGFLTSPPIKMQKEEWMMSDFLYSSPNLKSRNINRDDVAEEEEQEVRESKENRHSISGKRKRLDPQPSNATRAYENESDNDSNCTVDFPITKTVAPKTPKKQEFGMFVNPHQVESAELGKIKWEISMINSKLDILLQQTFYDFIVRVSYEQFKLEMKYKFQLPFMRTFKFDKTDSKYKSFMLELTGALKWADGIDLPQPKDQQVLVMARVGDALVLGATLSSDIEEFKGSALKISRKSHEMKRLIQDLFKLEVQACFARVVLEANLSKLFFVIQSQLSCLETVLNDATLKFVFPHLILLFHQKRIAIE